MWGKMSYSEKRKKLKSLIRLKQNIFFSFFVFLSKPFFCFYFFSLNVKETIAMNSRNLLRKISIFMI